MANIMSNLKSRFSKESKEPEEIEFSEISEQYSNKKKMPNPNFWQIYTAQKKCEEDISKYESQLEELQKRREDFADFLEPLGLSEADQKSAFSDIDNEINTVKSSILATRTNLSKTYEQIKMAQTSLDDYIKLASANPDFQISLRDAVINNSNTKIKEATAEKAKQSSYISFIEKLEDKAKNDPTLGDIFSSIEQARADKRKANSLEELKTNLQKLLGDVSKDNEDNLNNAIQTINSEVDSQKQNKSDTLQEEYQKLRDYISNNRKDFGLPEGTDDLKFDDKDSPLYVVTEFTDPNHDRSLKDIKQNYKDEITKIDRNISEYNKYIDFAKEDINNLTVERVKEKHTIKVYMLVHGLELKTSLKQLDMELKIGFKINHLKIQMKSNLFQLQRLPKLWIKKILEMHIKQKSEKMYINKYLIITRLKLNNKKLNNLHVIKMVNQDN